VKTSRTSFFIVFVTAPDLMTGRMLAQAALKARLIACANIVSKIESHYWWQGKIEKGAEILLIFKTTASRLVALEKLVLKLHPYETPEFVALPLSGGNRRYLQWLRSSCTEIAG
jgi:periplasmic divalent cation tolerance protein